MIRRPQKPLAHVIAARAEGEDPDINAAEARLIAARQRRRKEKFRNQIRLLMVCVAFVAGFGLVGGRMVMIASGDVARATAAATGAPILSDRADIVDRNGRLLATNVITPSLYARTELLIDPDHAARELARIFPDLDAAKLRRRFAPPTKFAWIKRRLSPEQAQAIYDIGEPGLIVGKRETRLYPNGQLAAHVLGGAGYGREDIHAAEVVGRDGVERWFDTRMRTETDTPLQVSLDLTVQSAVRKVLEGGMRLMNAKGASAVLMDARNGEVISLVSLPDYDPNYRPPNPTSGDPADSPLFNRAAQGRYELGSTYKLFTAALALETGLATPNTLVDTKPLKWGRYPIREFQGKDMGPFQSLTNILVKSSNIGSARLAMEFGTEAQKRFLRDLGMLSATGLELSTAKSAHPIYPKRWSEISTITISYGHGLSATPLHLAAAYASLLNGGIKVTPTLIKGGNGAGDAGGNGAGEAVRVVSAKTSASLRYMARKVVSEGTAQLSDIPGYHVMGKTGTAEKPKKSGGYDKEKVIANFAAVFPAHDPRYALVVTLDEPEDTVAGKKKRSAGWTVVPVAGEIIRRAAPILGLRPVHNLPSTRENAPAGDVTLASH